MGHAAEKRAADGDDDSSANESALSMIRPYTLRKQTQEGNTWFHHLKKNIIKENLA
jgi:hypothetical protein